MTTENPYQSPESESEPPVDPVPIVRFGIGVRVIVLTLVFAVIGAIVGPGCDAPPVESALVGGVLGSFLGTTTWRGILIIVGALMGLNIGALGGSAGAVLGLCVGVLLALLLGYGGRNQETV